MSSSVVTPITLIALLFLGTAAMMIGRRRRVGPDSQLSADWLCQFDTSKYFGLRTLLLREDFEFFRRQQGFDPALQNRLRRERLKIARSYVDQLEADVRQLIRFGRAFVACSDSDADGLSLVLFQEEVLFARRLFMIRSRLFLYSLRLICEVDFRSLLDPMSDLANRVTQIAIH